MSSPIYICPVLFTYVQSYLHMSSPIYLCPVLFTYVQSYLHMPSPIYICPVLFTYVQSYLHMPSPNYICQSYLCKTILYSLCIGTPGSFILHNGIKSILQLLQVKGTKDVISSNPQLKKWHVQLIIIPQTFIWSFQCYLYFPDKSVKSAFVNLTYPLKWRVTSNYVSSLFNGIKTCWNLHKLEFNFISLGYCLLFTLVQSYRTILEIGKYCA